MKRILPLVAVMVLMGAALKLLTAFAPAAETAAKPDADALRAGRNFIPTPAFTEEEDQKVLDLFKGLRVSDVVDGMDAVGLQDIGLVSPNRAKTGRLTRDRMRGPLSESVSLSGSVATWWWLVIDSVTCQPLATLVFGPKSRCKCLGRHGLRAAFRPPDPPPIRAIPRNRALAGAVQNM